MYVATYIERLRQLTGLSLSCVLSLRSNPQVRAEVDGLEGIDIVPFEESSAGTSRLLNPSLLSIPN